MIRVSALLSGVGSVELNGPRCPQMLFWSPAMVLKVRKVITKLEESCPWYIFTEKQLELRKYHPQI